MPSSARRFWQSASIFFIVNDAKTSRFIIGINIFRHGHIITQAQFLKNNRNP